MSLRNAPVIAAALLALLYALPAHAQNPVQDCQRLTSEIKIGMTRADVEKRMGHDGGIAGIYKGERLYFTGKDFTDGATGRSVICKLSIDFRPAGLSDAIYLDPNRFRQWRDERLKARRQGLLRRAWHGIIRSKAGYPSPFRDPTDEVVNISTPFLEQPIYD